MLSMLQSLALDFYRRMSKLGEIIKLSFMVLVSAISIHSCTLMGLGHCSSSAPSPAAAPINRGLHIHDLILKRIRRSLPAACHSKCNNCRPCMPVMALVRPINLQEYDYYPQVWKCMCRDQLFSP
uniref:Epidermal patterning factor-like protein n=1 Tax=Kalanchoe fedtschenkoi TaxID=63787 RepID=A0A7N0TVW2_KALFE